MPTKISWRDVVIAFILALVLCAGLYAAVTWYVNRTDDDIVKAVIIQNKLDSLHLDRLEYEASQL